MAKVLKEGHRSHVSGLRRMMGNKITRKRLLARLDEDCRRFQKYVKGNKENV